jgi:hypothetical protein
MAIYNYPSAAVGFAQLQQQELDNCM